MKALAKLLDLAKEGSELRCAFVLAVRQARKEPRESAERLALLTVARGALRKHVGDAAAGICLECGCTDDDACPEGCGWANPEHTLCTACDRGLQ